MIVIVGNGDAEQAAGDSPDNGASSAIVVASLAAAIVVANRIAILIAIAALCLGEWCDGERDGPGKKTGADHVSDLLKFGRTGPVYSLTLPDTV